MANRNDEALRAEVLSLVRAVEALKGECGMDPESPQAIRNGQYTSISARLYLIYEALTPRPEPAGRVECRECKDTGVFYWHDGPTKRAATCPCRRRAAHAPQEGAEGEGND